MMQAHPIPYMHASDGLPVESMAASAVALLGSDERHDQIELRPCVDHPADAAKNAIHLSKCSETIDIDGLQAGGLRQQFFVAHDGCSPHLWKTNHDTAVSGWRQKNGARLQKVIASRSSIGTVGGSA